MVSPQEFWIILGLAVVISLLLGAGAAYFLLPMLEKKEDDAPPKPTKKESTKTTDRIRKMFQLITDLTVTLNYSRVLEKSLDAAVLALRLSDLATERLISAVLLFSEEDMAVPDLVVAYGRGLPRPDLGTRVPGVVRPAGTSDRIRQPPYDQRNGSRSGAKTVYILPGLRLWLLHSAPGWPGHLWCAAIWAPRPELFYGRRPGIDRHSSPPGADGDG